MATTVVLGNLIVRPTRATLFSSNSLLVNMSPYVRFTYNGKEYRTKPAVSQDKHPVFVDTFEFTQLGDTRLVVTVWDKSVIADDCLGETTVDFAPVFQAFRHAAAAKLFRKGKHVGDVFFEFEYRPLPGVRPVQPYQVPGMPPVQPYQVPGTPGAPAFGTPPTGYGYPGGPYPQTHFGAPAQPLPMDRQAIANLMPGYGGPQPQPAPEYPPASGNSQSLYPNDYKLGFKGP